MTSSVFGNVSWWKYMENLGVSPVIIKAFLRRFARAWNLSCEPTELKSTGNTVSQFKDKTFTSESCSSSSFCFCLDKFRLWIRSQALQCFFNSHGATSNIGRNVKIYYIFLTMVTFWIRKTYFFHLEDFPVTIIRGESYHLISNKRSSTYRSEKDKSIRWFTKWMFVVTGNSRRRLYLYLRMLRWFQMFIV